MTRDYGALAAYFESRSAVPFDWDGNCCASFALGAIKAQFGRAPHIGHSWTTATGAARVLKKLGGIEAATDRILHPIPLGHAMRGDIAACEDPVFGMLLTVIAGQTLIGPCTDGIRQISRASAVKAWRSSADARHV